MVNAIILAGDNGEDGRPKALLKIGSRYMVEYVISSLRESGCIKNIYIVGDESIKNEVGHLVDGYIKSGRDILENIRIAVREIGDKTTNCIISTCDIPMVKGEAIKDFVERCRGLQIDMGYPIIDKKLNDEKYPDVKRTYVKLKDGTYTGGNMMYINPQIIDKFTEKAALLVEFRKKPFKMGQVLGLSFLVRLALGMLTIPSIEEKMEEMFGVRGSAIKTSYPEIGNDVDKPSDIEFVNKHINKIA